MCHKHFQPDDNWVDKLSDSQLKVLAKAYVVVDEFHTMGCFNWKIGSTTWQYDFYE